MTPYNDQLIFERGRVELNLSQLSNSVRYQMANGSLPKTRPMEHFQFIESLMEQADQYNLAPKLESIIATERQALRVNYEGDLENCPVENILFQRLVTRIHLGADYRGLNIAIAIAFNEKGVELAFGTNVHVCSNQQIFGENVLRSFGADKMPFDKILQLFQRWLIGFEEEQQFQFDVIDRLQTIDIDHEEIEHVTGDLFSRAVRFNAGEDIKAPLNQLQVADFVRSQNSHIYEREGAKTAWDMVQFGTHQLKPHNSDLITMSKHNNEFCNYMLNRYTQT